ncbi:hypothetical protein VTK56DRAFT_1728 [Thermocarpiscus australiensis]
MAPMSRDPYVLYGSQPKAHSLLDAPTWLAKLTWRSASLLLLKPCQGDEGPDLEQDDAYTVRGRTDLRLPAALRLRSLARHTLFMASDDESSGQNSVAGVGNPRESSGMILYFVPPVGLFDPLIACVFASPSEPPANRRDTLVSDPFESRVRTGRGI